MSDALQAQVEEITRRERIDQYNEDQTKQSILLPILQLLGWSIFDVQEVFPEYSAGKGRVDYALRLAGSNRVFVEAKRCSADLEAHQEQLLNYAFQHGVPLAVLTNGTVWWFYLPLREGVWEQRKFYSIDLQQRDAPDVARQLRAFLSREQVAAGKAVAQAEEVLTSQKRQAEVERTLPKAWRELLSSPEPALIELLRDRVEQQCGYSPTNGEVAHYLSRVPKAGRVKLAGAPTYALPSRSASGVTATVGEGDTGPAIPIQKLIEQGATGKKPVALLIGAERVPVNKWSDLTLATVRWLLDKGLLPASALPIRTHAGKQRYLVNSVPQHGKEKLGGSWKSVGPVFVDTRFSANDHLKNVRAALQQTGQYDLGVEVELRAP